MAVYRTPYVYPILHINNVKLFNVPKLINTIHQSIITNNNDVKISNNSLFIQKVTFMIN